MEVTKCFEHSSLLHYVIDYVRKKFYDFCLRLFLLKCKHFKTLVTHKRSSLHKTDLFLLQNISTAKPSLVSLVINTLAFCLKSWNTYFKGMSIQ